MTPVQIALLTIVPGAVTALGFLAVSFLPTGARNNDTEGPSIPDGVLRRLAFGLLAALAFVPADVGLNQWHEIWPKDGTNRYLGVTLAAGLVALLHGAIRWCPPVLLVRALLGASIAIGVLEPLPDQFVPRSVLIGLAIATGLWMGVGGFVVDFADRRLPRVAVPLAFLGAIGVVAPGLFKSGYAGGAQLAGALGSMVGGIVFASLLRRKQLGPAGPAWTVLMGLYAAILLVTYGYVDVPAWWALPVMAIAPLGVVAGLLVGSAAKRPLVRVAASTCAAVLIGGAATTGVLIASGGSGEDADGDSEDPSYYGY